MAAIRVSDGGCRLQDSKLQMKMSEVVARFDVDMEAAGMGCRT